MIMQHKSHNPASLLSPLSTPQPNRIAIVLNAPIADLQLLRRVWRNCGIRVCADGGANRLFDFLHEGRKEREGGEEGEEEVGEVERLVSVISVLFVLCALCFVLLCAARAVWAGEGVESRVRV